MEVAIFHINYHRVSSNILLDFLMKQLKERFAFFSICANFLQIGVGKAFQWPANPD